MRYALCSLSSENFIALSVSIKTFVKYAASGLSEPHWKARIKSFVSSFVNLISV
jgi:hypothetical protein